MPLNGNRDFHTTTKRVNRSKELIKSLYDLGATPEIISAVEKYILSQREGVRERVRLHRRRNPTCNVTCNVTPNDVTLQGERQQYTDLYKKIDSYNKIDSDSRESKKESKEESKIVSKAERKKESKQEEAHEKNVKCYIEYAATQNVLEAEALVELEKFSNYYQAKNIEPSFLRWKNWIINFHKFRRDRAGNGYRENWW